MEAQEHRFASLWNLAGKTSSQQDFCREVRTQSVLEQALHLLWVAGRCFSALYQTAVDGPVWITSHRVAMPSRGKVAQRQSTLIAQFTHLLWLGLRLKFLAPDLENMTHTKGAHSVVTGEQRSPWSHLRSTWKGMWPVFRTRGTEHNRTWRCEVMW